MNLILGRVDSGLMTRSELLATGHTVAEIERERSSGRLTTLSRGTYAPGHQFRDLPVEQRHAVRARAAAIAAPSLVVSHTSAAVLHGLPVRNSVLNRTHLTRAGRTGGRAEKDRVLHAGSFAMSDVVEIDGVRVTSVARTLVDLSRMEPFESAVMTADAALHRFPEIGGDVAEALGRARHQNGAGAARRALYFADGRSESVGESRLRVFNHVVGLPVPELQCTVFNSAARFIGRTDLGYLDYGVLVEFDGKIKYGRLLAPGRSALDVLEEEKTREDGLWELGWQVIRVVWSELSDPVLLQLRVRAMLERGTRALAANGIAGSVVPLPPIRVPR